LALREEETNIKLKPRRILAVLGVVVLIVGGYVGWQLYKGQQMAKQYTTDAQQQAQGSGNAATPANSQTAGANGTTPTPTSGQTAPAQTSPNSSSVVPPASGTQPDSSAPAAQSPSSGEYKQLMSGPYQQTLQAMSTVKSSTLALQGRTMSLSAYKASTLQSQATFASAEAFVRANPPKQENLNASYQEFLAGISLANQSMGVVLKGISSFSPSNFYAAREMGKKAQQQVTEAYAHF